MYRKIFFFLLNYRIYLIFKYIAFFYKCIVVYHYYSKKVILLKNESLHKNCRKEYIKIVKKH